MTPKMHDLKLRESILKFKPTVLQVQVIEFSIMEPPAIKKKKKKMGGRRATAAEQRPHGNQYETIKHININSHGRPPDEPSYAL